MTTQHEPFSTSNPCRPWCTLPASHEYNDESSDGDWSREHEGFSWTMTLTQRSREGGPLYLEVCVVADETVRSGYLSHPLVGKPTMIVFAGNGNLMLTPGEARQWSAAMADAASHLETALLQSAAKRPDTMPGA